MLKSHINQHFYSINNTVLLKIKKKAKSFSHFIWLILLIFITILVTYFYETNKKSQLKYLEKTLKNVYFQKSLTKLTSSLENRHLEFYHIVKSGDSFETIINLIKIPKSEKRIFLDTV